MQGIILSGTGTGAKYVKLYLDVFEDKLGITPYLGTLNIKVNELPKLDYKKMIQVQKEGFAKVDCYPIIVQKNYKGFLIKPHITQHPDDVVEIISEINLREKLKLNNEDKLECELV
jgi:riboflavin kinase, archaea type